MPFEYWTICKPDNFWPIEYQTCSCIMQKSLNSSKLVWNLGHFRNSVALVIQLIFHDLTTQCVLSIIWCSFIQILSAWVYFLVFRNPNQKWRNWKSIPTTSQANAWPLTVRGNHAKENPRRVSLASWQLNKTITVLIGAAVPVNLPHPIRRMCYGILLGC